MDSAVTPKCKKLCNKPTPESMKHRPCTSTPFGKLAKPKKTIVAKTLDFHSLSIHAERNSRCIKIRNVPRPFVGLNVVKAIEKYLRKEGIAPSDGSAIINRFFDYCKKSNTVLLECASEELAGAVVNLKNLRFFNTFLEFEEVSLNPLQDVSVIPPPTPGNSNKDVDLLGVCTNLDIPCSVYDEKTVHQDFQNNSVPAPNSFTNNGDDHLSLPEAYDNDPFNSLDGYGTDHITGIENDENLHGKTRTDDHCIVIDDNCDDEVFVIEDDNDVQPRTNIGTDHHSLMKDNDNCGTGYVSVHEDECVKTSKLTVKNVAQVDTQKHSESSRFVRVTNVPEDVVEDLLVALITTAMEEADLLHAMECNSDTIVKSCSVVNHKESSITLEFVSSELATRACVLDGLDYLGSPLRFTKIIEDSNSDTVMVLNVPFGKEALVRKYLEAAFKRERLSQDGEPVILNLVKKGNAVFIKLQNKVIAQEIIKMGELNFLSHVLKFSPVQAPPQKSVTLASTGVLQTASKAESDVLPQKNISQIINVDVLQKSASEAPVTKMQSADYLIKSDAGKVLFLKKLILTRRLFYQKQNFASAHARLMAEVREANVDVDLNDVEKRRRYWQDVNNHVKRGKQTSVFSAPLKVIFDNAPIETLVGTEFEVHGGSEGLGVIHPHQVAATAAMFSKGAVFPNDAARYLVKVVKVNHDIFKNARNQDHFWREVSSIMSEREHYFDGPSCERKFDMAKKLYRDHARMIQRTGGEGPSVGKKPEPWFWNEDMHFLMERDHISKPPMTVSIGSSNITAMAEAQDHCPRQLEEEYIPRVGRSRIPQLQRPKSKQDARTDAYIQIAAALNRRTDVLLNVHKPKEARPHSGSVCDPVKDDEEEEENRWGGHAVIPKLKRP